ncbi:MAG: glycosyltransferase [Phycisphaerales bacterium]|nr:glycosyltransferase [Phycisphaerales bacterium]
MPWAAMVLESLVDHVDELVFSHGGGEQVSMLRELSPSMMSRVTLHEATAKTRLGSRESLAALANAAGRFDPDRIFVNSIDDFASNLFRASAMGMGPPRSLSGRLCGLYLRPRPLDETTPGFANAVKGFGARRIFRRGLFSRLGLLDEFLERTLRAEGRIPTTWIPDFHRPRPVIGRDEARARMQIPEERTSLLFFGVPEPRKGLGLVIEAFKRGDLENATVFIAGRLPQDPDLRRGLMDLERQGRAVVRDGFVSESEVATVFAAADRVLIPYRSHYGSSGVLSLAAAAGRPVIASDFQLLGRRVAAYDLGLVHRNEDAGSLHDAIQESLDATPARIAEWTQGLGRWADLNSADRFGAAIRVVAGLSGAEGEDPVGAAVSTEA